MAGDDKPNTRRPRLSIGRKHTDSGVVAELLMLLETITSDGRASEEETRNLAEWLQSNGSDLNLPGIEFLRTTIREILADGKVSAEEKTALYKAVEKVLPTEARRLAKERRRATETLENERQRAAKEEEKEREKAERERNRPLQRANFMVAGVAYEGRDAVIRRFVTDSSLVFLARDKGNPYDANAIEIRLKEGYQIGFVPREDAEDLAPLLDAGCTHQAYVTKILQGKRWPIPVVQAYMYRPQADIQGVVSQAQIPQKQQAPPGLNSLGCFGRSVIALGLTSLLLLTLLAFLR